MISYRHCFNYNAESGGALRGRSAAMSLNGGIPDTLGRHQRRQIL